jgi:ribosomal protein S12 methylthiotransferase
VSEPKTKTIGLISLGCPKNRVDSEVMLGFLAKQGFKIISSENDAEVIVIIPAASSNQPSKNRFDASWKPRSLRAQGRVKSSL